MFAGRIYLISFVFMSCAFHLKAQVAGMANKKQAAEKAREYYSRGLICQQNDQLPESIVFLDSAIQYNPDYTEAYFSIGGSYERAGNFTKALLAYEKALSLMPDFTGARFRKAVCFYNLQMYKEAIGELDQLVAGGGGGVTNAIFYRYSESEGLQISTDNQLSAEFFLYRGLAYLEIQKPDIALNDLDSAVFLSGNAADYLVNRGLAYQKLNLKKEAQADYKNALAKDPENQTALLNLFTLDPAAGKAYLTDNPDINDGIVVPELLAQQAYLAYLEDDFSTALSFYNQALKTKPGETDWILNRSLCLTKTGRLNEAEEEMHRVLQMNDHSPRVYLYLGNLYFMKENFENAVSFYNQFIALEPSHSSAYLNRGLCFDRLGLQEKACRDLQKAYALGQAQSEEPLNVICRK